MKKFIKFSSIPLAMLIWAQNIVAQDDIYFMPSKQKTNESKTMLGIDTSGMTDYEKYRALKENSTNKQEVNSLTKSENIELSNAQPSFVVVNNDTTTGNVVINNYYIDNDRLNSYRRLYFDYYYDPFFYDPFYYDYWWGYPYFSFSLGYHYPYPYYGYYWHRPYYYGYHSYYFGYWRGFIHGYYWGYYNDNPVPQGTYYSTIGRRMGTYTNPKSIESASYYSGRFAANDYYHGSRRNGTTVVRSNLELTQVNQAANTRRNVAVYKTNSNNTQPIATTRPYTSNTNYRRSSYVPTYTTNVVSENRRTSNVTGAPSGYVVVNNRRIKSSDVNTTDNTNITNTPRRPSETYTPVTRSNVNTESTRRPVTSVRTNDSPSSYSAPANNTSSSNSNNSSSNSGSGRRR